jgi:hypothetical protein
LAVLPSCGVRKKTMADTPLVLSDLATRIREAHERCHASMTQGLQHALEAGQLLIQAKDQIPHGEWLTWLQTHCDIGERQSQNYMRLARDLPRLNPANTQRVADLSVRQALTLVSENAHTAHQLRKLPEEQQAELFEQTAQRKVENLAQAHQERVSSRKRKRAQRAAQRAQETLQEQRRVEYPDPLPPPGGIRICGMDESALEVVLEELQRSGNWYHDLAGRLNQVYEPRLKQLAMAVVEAILALRERLSYSRESLLHAVEALRQLLGGGPVPGNEIARWARNAGISWGLLFLAAKLVGVVVLRGKGNEAVYSLARTCLWALRGDPRIAEYREPDGAAREDDATITGLQRNIELPEPHGDPAGVEGTEREGRWQRRKREKKERQQTPPASADGARDRAKGGTTDE